MKLTGRSKEDFEKWYQNKDFGSETQPMAYWFYRLPESMQWGVYVDFFDSKGLSIGVYKTDAVKWFGMILRDNRYLNNFKESYPNLSEARKSAIEKANEIYNSL